MAAACTVTEQTHRRIRTVRFDWTASATGGVFSGLGTSSEVSGRIFMVATIPSGTNAPTNLYDVTLTSSDTGTYDLAGSAIQNRSSTLTQSVCATSGGAKLPAVKGTLSIGVTNAGANNQGTVIVYLR